MTEREKTKNKKVFFFLHIFSLPFFLFPFLSCQSSYVLPPQESCHFTQNNHLQRISIKNPPLTLEIHSSIPEEYHESIRTAAQRWNNLHQEALFRVRRFHPPPNSNRNEEDFINPKSDSFSIVSFKRDWSSDWPIDEQAKTVTYYRGPNILEADIVFNRQNFLYSSNDSPSIQEVHFESLALHELGHAEGFDHFRIGVMSRSLSRGVVRLNFDTLILDSLRCEYSLRSDSSSTETDR